MKLLKKKKKELKWSQLAKEPETLDQLEGDYAIRYSNRKYIVTDLGCDESTYL